MKIFKYTIGQLQTNCYFLVDEENNCIIIDPGDEGGFLLEQIQIKKLKPKAILLTHGHFDHVIAVGELQTSFDIPLFFNKNDLFLLRKAKESAYYFLKYQPQVLPIRQLKDLSNKKFFKINNFRIKILATPGHTPGSSCFYFIEEKVLFTGDTLFKKGIGRYDFYYSSKKDLINSLKKIFKLPPETKIFPGHGDESNLKNEKDFIFSNFLV